MDNEDSSDKETSQPLLTESEKEQEFSTTYKVGRTVVLFLLWLSNASFAEITGPIFPELVVQTHSSYDVVAQCVSLRAAGHGIGGIVGGLSGDRTIAYIDMMMTGVLLLYTCVSVGTAYVQSTTLLYVVMAAQGSLETYLHISGNIITFKTWKGKAAGPLLALQMGYGLGSAIVAQIVAPFLDPRFSRGVVQTGYNNSCKVSTSSHYSKAATQTSDSNTSAFSVYLNRQHNLTVPQGPEPKYPANFVTAYWILAGMNLAMAAVFLFYHIHGRVTGIRLDDRFKKQKTSQLSHFKRSLSPRSCSPTKPVYAALIIGCLFFYYSLSVPMARGFSKFLFSYARDGPCLSVTESTSLQSSFFVAMTIGRLCGFLGSSVIHIKYILQIEVLGAFVSCMILYFLHDNVTMLWVTIYALGFFTGPIIPSAYAWANRYIEITSVVQMIPQLGAAGGDIAYLILLGYNYDHFGPYVLWTFQLFLCSGFCVVTWVMQIFGSLHGDRYDTKTINYDDEEEESE